MEIKHLKHHEIDKNRWDSSLLNCTNALIYANSFYLDIVSPNWQAFVSDDYSCLFPLPVKQKLGISYLSHPLFAQQLGLFCDDKNLVNTAIFFHELNSKYRRYSLKMNALNKFSDENQSSRSNYILPITTKDKMLSSFNQNTKRNLKKTNEFTISFTQAINSEDFIELKKQTSRAVLNEEEWLRMKDLIDKLLELNFGFFLGILDGDKLIAAVFFTKWKNRICYLFSASNEQGMERRASFAIIDKVIKDNLNANFILDFEGSMDENIARFFKGFGAKEEVYYEIKRSF